MGYQVITVCVQSYVTAFDLAWASCPGLYTVYPQAMSEIAGSVNSARYDQETRPVDELFVLMLFLWLSECGKDTLTLSCVCTFCSVICVRIQLI